MMTLAEMLDIIEDKAGFEMILQTLDVPAFSISNATCIGPISRRDSLAVDEVRFLRRHTDKPVKVPLPGPYLLTRGMFVREVTQPHYETKEALGDAVVEILRSEIRELLDQGADFIQFDEPVFSRYPDKVAEWGVDALDRCIEAVSYTHLTLPTILLV